MGCASGIFSLDIAMSDSVTVSGHRDGSLKFWSIRDSRMLHEMKNIHDSSISSVQYLPGDGNYVITSSRDQTVKLVDVRMFKVAQTYENELWSCYCETSAVGISPRGKYLALPSRTGKMIVLNRDNNTVEDVFDKEHKSNAIVSVDWSSRTSKVASIDTKGNVILWG